MNELVWLILQEKYLTKNVDIVLIKYFKLKFFWKTNDIFINIFLKIKVYFIFALFEEAKYAPIKFFH